MKIAVCLKLLLMLNIFSQINILLFKSNITNILQFKLYAIGEYRDKGFALTGRRKFDYKSVHCALLD